MNFAVNIQSRQSVPCLFPKKMQEMKDRFCSNHFTCFLLFWKTCSRILFFTRIFATFEGYEIYLGLDAFLWNIEQWMTNRFVYIAKQSLPNGTHLKAKNVSSEQIRVLKNDKRICSRLTALTKKRRTLVLSKSVCQTKKKFSKPPRQF